MTDHQDDRLCRHCGAPIRFYTDQIGGWWSHPLEDDGHRQRCEDEFDITINLEEIA